MGIGGIKMSKGQEVKYEIKEEEYKIKRPQQPRAEDYYDITESEAERAERIYLYSEVVE